MAFAIFSYNFFLNGVNHTIHTLWVLKVESKAPYSVFIFLQYEANSKEIKNIK